MSRGDKHKILFVSHDASRTGAPIVLMHLLKWLKGNTTTEFYILLKDGGELEADFASIAPTYLLNKKSPPKPFYQRALTRIKSKFQKEDYKTSILKDLSKQNFDLIYLNTVASNKLAKILKETFKCPVICHIHENEFSIRSFYTDSLASGVKDHIDHYIAVSESGRQNLIQNYAIDPTHISLFYEFISIAKIQCPTRSIDLVKNELNLRNEFVVGGSGLTSWRKGADIFVSLALHIKKIKSNHKIKFIWVGFVEPVFKAGFDYEKKRIGLEDEVQFIGSKNEPANYFQIFDIFALTSREDPFPLVCLETAALAKPILCFDNAGGMPEFVKQETGYIIPYGDIEKMAMKIIELSEQPESLMRLGANAKQAVAQYDVEVIAPRIHNFMSNFINNHA